MREALADQGAVRVPALIDGVARAELVALFEQLPARKAGRRLPPETVAALAGVRATTALVRTLLNPDARVVRALLFDKTAEANWALGWHQDRTIEVAERRVVPGFGPWTIKAGRPHVAPPPALLAEMLTVRLHLDPVDEGNAPLIIAPGSHRLGLVPEGEIAATVEKCGTATCLAATGDVWVYRTLILHASRPADRPRHRRVLQLDYAAASLPGGLGWAGDA